MMDFDDVSCSCGSCERCTNALFDTLVADVSLVRRSSIPLAHGSWREECVDDEGRLHDDGLRPAVSEFYADGVLAYEAHFVHGVASDVGTLPARVWYHRNGRPSCVQHMDRGTLHDYRRSNGDIIPASVHISVRGHVERAESWLHGRPQGLIDR